MRVGIVVVCALSRVAVTAARVPLPTSITYWDHRHDSDNPFLEHKRAATATTAAPNGPICGYESGNVNSPRCAQSGYDCRVDAAHGIWGFCTTTVISASDCGLAAACIDAGRCSDGCYIDSDTGLITFTCPSSGTETLFCSTAMLTVGIDQTYGYIACGAEATTDHYIATPTITSSMSTTLTSTSSTSSSTLLLSPALLPTSTKSQAPSSAVSPSSAVADTDQARQSTGGSTIGAVIGGVLGGIALICLSAVAVVFIIKRRSLHDGKPSTDPFPSSSAPPCPSYPPRPPAAAVYEADSSSSSQNVGWKDQTPKYYPMSPVELPSQTNY